MKRNRNGISLFLKRKIAFLKRKITGPNIYAEIHVFVHTHIHMFAVSSMLRSILRKSLSVPHQLMQSLRMQYWQ